MGGKGPDQGIGGVDLPAPQAGLMAALSQGIVRGEMNWPLVIVGIAMGLAYLSRQEVIWMGLTVLLNSDRRRAAVGREFPGDSLDVIGEIEDKAWSLASWLGDVADDE